MKLDVEIKRQKKDSPDCGIACLSMIFSYYHINKSVDEIKKEFYVPKYGLFTQELGIYLLNNGFDVEIVTLNPHIFTTQMKNFNTNEIADHFKKLIKMFKDDEIRCRGFRLALDFIKLGGKYTLKIPSKNDIENEIKAQRPMISFISSRFLQLNFPDINYHFQTIIGIENSNVYIIDPRENELGGEKKFDINEYLYAIYSSLGGGDDGACIMKIRK